MKIIQIHAVVESTDTGSEDRGTWQRIPSENATIYGLGDDGRVYVWRYRTGGWVAFQKEALIPTKEELENE